MPRIAQKIKGCNCKGPHHSGACKRRRGVGGSKESKMKKQSKEARRAYQLRNRDVISAANKRRTQQLKAAAIAHYGICPCGENRPDVLEVDHISGGSQDHRRGGGSAISWPWVSDLTAWNVPNNDRS